MRKNEENYILETDVDVSGTYEAGMNIGVGSVLGNLAAIAGVALGTYVTATFVSSFIKRRRDSKLAEFEAVVASYENVEVPKKDETTF